MHSMYAIGVRHASTWHSGGRIRKLRCRAGTQHLHKSEGPGSIQQSRHISLLSSNDVMGCEMGIFH